LFSKSANVESRGGNLWRQLEVLRCLPSQNEPLLHGVRSQSFEVVGRRITGCVEHVQVKDSN
jgi:hypothetical protein